MAFRVENKDLVISGFEEGIADTPYKGIADMRNVDIIGVPGEASVNFSMTTATQPPVFNNFAYTASASTDRLTVASTTGMYEGCAISVTPDAIFSFNSLVVGGGGGGGGGTTTFQERTGGGGGAGRLISTAHTGVAGGAYTVTIGAGGAGGAADGSKGTSGSTSSLGALVSAPGGGGGGGGTGANKNGINGASGGGGGPQSGTGGTGTGGFAGGTGNAAAGAGGGGGSSSVGANGGAVNGGAGGAGTASSISGSSVTYAGGGGGGDLGAGAAGGGNGGSASNGTAATANTGSGGGGAGGDNVNPRAGGAGGSGVVIISYTTGTVNATGGTITTSGGNTIHTFTTSGVFTVLDLTASTVYYVRNIVGLTFQISIAPLGSILDIGVNGTGTLTTYQYGNQRSVSAIAPVSYFVDKAGQAIGVNGVYLMDGSNYAWVYFPVANSTLPAYSLIFLGNIGGIGASSDVNTGVAAWNSYLLLYGSASGASIGTVDIANIQDILEDGPLAEWSYSWQTSVGVVGTNNRISVLPAQEDGNLYWTSASGLGSIIETPGDTFDPTDSASYTFTDDAVSVPDGDRSTCIAELGTQLLIGGRRSFVYVWDKISLGFTSLLNMPDAFTTNIVAASQNAYVFAGVLGRIYITNGSGISRYKKVPDYVTSQVRPYMQWLDASFNRDQLYFSFIAYDNAGNALTTTAGGWAIDLETDQLRLLNKTTNTTYAGTVRMVVEMPRPALVNTSTNVVGDGLTMGWYSGTTYVVDRPQTAPYTSYETYIETDMIPVGTYLNQFTPSQVEWKTSVPLGSNGTAESIRISYRTRLGDSFTVLGSSTATGTSMVGTTTGTTITEANISDWYQASFQKSQWVQLKVEMSSNATTPTYCRLTEVRIRDWPS